MWVGLTFNASTEEDGAGGLLKSEASFDGLVSESLSPITIPPPQKKSFNKQTNNKHQSKAAHSRKGKTKRKNTYDSDT